MKRSALSRYRDDFNKAVDHAIRECSRQSGTTDLETVYRYVRSSSSVLLEHLKVLLADEQVRIIIQHRLKRCTVSVKAAAAQAYREALQAEFEFFDMEQFRGVPQRISFPDKPGGPMQYVEYHRSRRWQREASIAHLGRGIGADIARRNAEVAAHEFLEPLVEKYGDLDPEELIRLWREEEVKGEKR